MKAVLTGDIVNSRNTKAEVWLKVLKEVLEAYGQPPGAWEIYRGDSFQALVSAENALKLALHLKASMKQFDQLDVRIGIGIGKVDFESGKVTSSNGEAFVRSGHSFETLKKQNIFMTSGNENLDTSINTMLGLALYIANRWTPTVSKIIKLVIEQPDLKQQELADHFKKSQSNISEALKRGGFNEIMMMNTYYISQIQAL